MIYTSVSPVTKMRLLMTACIAGSSFMLVSAQETHTVSFTNKCVHEFMPQ